MYPIDRDDNMRVKVFDCEHEKDLESDINMFLADNSYDIISLDHDLSEDKTGYDIAKYIVENQIKVGAVAIHSANPVGKFNINQLLTHYGYKVL